MILAIDVSGQLGLITLELPDGVLLTRHSDLPREHTAFLGRALEELQAEAGLPWSDLKRVAVTIGPGSFTGLRIGLATAKGLVFGRDIPLAPLPSLLLPLRAAGESCRRGIVIRPARGNEAWGALLPAEGAIPIWEKMVTAEQLATEIAELGGEEIVLMGTAPRGGDPWPQLIPEPPPAAQLSALARLARSCDNLVTGPELDRLLPRYLMEPSVSRPRPRPVVEDRRRGRS